MADGVEVTFDSSNHATAERIVQRGEVAGRSRTRLTLSGAPPPPRESPDHPSTGGDGRRSLELPDRPQSGERLDRTGPMTDGRVSEAETRTRLGES
jgi:hypothetical protein